MKENMLLYIQESEATYTHLDIVSHILEVQVVLFISEQLFNFEV